MTVQHRGFDLVVIGTGFGSAFFLHKALQRLRPNARCLVLERGGVHTHQWQLEHGRNSDIESADTIRTRPGEKPWRFSLGFGGGTNCWWGVTPRMHPTDFALRTRYGVGRDWPLSYEDLEPFYGEAESIMGIAGDDDIGALFPRSTAFPQPPHVLTTADQRMKAAMPGLHFALPTARSSVPTPQRGVCCANATCGLCPTNAKFTVLNGMTSTFSDPRVELVTRAEVHAIETEGGRARRILYRREGREESVEGDLVVLGANALFSPAILQRSGIDSAVTGRGLHEQLSLLVDVFFDGLDHFDGGTATTGVNYALFDGAHRREMSGVAVMFRNWPIHGFRLDPGRWRQVMPLQLMAEVLPDDENRIFLATDSPVPTVYHGSRSEYATRGLDRAFAGLPELLAPLPVERIESRGYRDSEAHMQGTLRMGRDPSDSVVDAGQVHHTVRNLVVVGTSVFPSCGIANPSLTAAALSLRAASRLFPAAS